MKNMIVFEREDDEWEFWSNTVGTARVTIKISKRVPTKNLPPVLERIIALFRQILRGGIEATQIIAESETKIYVKE